MTISAVGTLSQLYSDEDIRRAIVLQRIQDSLQNLPDEEPIPPHIMSNLEEAIELDSDEAICCLADFIVENRTPLTLVKKIHYLELAASLGHVEATFFCGCIYGNLLGTSVPENLIHHSKALTYLQKAVELDHPKATFVLLKAIFSSQEPKIDVSQERCCQIAEELIAKGDIRAALYYGAALAGYELQEFHFNVQLVKNYELSAKNLLLAFKEGSRSIREQALAIIRQGYLDKIWSATYNTEFEKLQILETTNDNQNNWLSVLKNFFGRF